MRYSLWLFFWFNIAIYNIRFYLDFVSVIQQFILDSYPRSITITQHKKWLFLYVHGPGRIPRRRVVGDSCPAANWGEPPSIFHWFLLFAFA